MCLDRGNEIKFSNYLQSGTWNWEIAKTRVVVRKTLF
jgi:hypothetical protein